MEKKAVLKNYGFLAVMLLCMLGGGVFGWLLPKAAGAVKPLGSSVRGGRIRACKVIFKYSHRLSNS